MARQESARLHMSGHDGLSPEKESQILDGAAAVFAEAGYAGASMSRIAAVAGVSKGTLYNYFTGKRELFIAFMRRVYDAHFAMIFDDDHDGSNAEQELARMCRRIMELLVSQDGLLVYRMVIAEAPNFPELAEAFYAVGAQRGLARMTDWVRRNAAACHMDVEDPEFAAEQLFALIQTRVVLRRRLRLTDSVTADEIDRVVGAGVRLFLRGYGTLTQGTHRG
jgi:AcrR family transcriptional regulator